jgi:hypothetical protein
MTFPTGDDLRNIWLNLVASGLWVIGTFLFSALIGVYLRDRGRFAGRWPITITRDATYAESLFGTPVQAPHSGGRIALAYGTGSKKDHHWGIGCFELRASTQQYAQLCVEFDNVTVGYKVFNLRLPLFLLAKFGRGTATHSSASVRGTSPMVRGSSIGWCSRQSRSTACRET